MLKGRLQRAFTAFAPEGDVGRRVLHGLVGVAGVGIVHRFLGLAVALVLARHLGTYTYGQYAFATSLAALLGVVATFGIPPVAMREIARHDGRGDAARLAGQVRASWRMAFIAVALALALGVPLAWLGGGLAAFDLTTYLVALMLVPPGAALTLLCAVLQGLRKAVESSLPGQVVQPVAMLLALFGMVLLLGM